MGQVTRLDKGSALSYLELDNNFRFFNLWNISKDFKMGMYVFNGVSDLYVCLQDLVAADNILLTNQSYWRKIASISSANLEDLANVIINSIQSGDVLINNGSDWVNVNINVGNILFVSKNGNDGTAVKGNYMFSYNTVKAAVTAAGSGDLVFVMPGNYDETAIDLKSNLNIYLEKGVIIQPTTNSGNASIFTNIVIGADVNNINIFGKGSLISLGFASSNTSAVNIKGTTSTINLELDTITSINCYNGAKLKIKNTTIKREIFSYSDAEITVENCLLLNIIDIVRNSFPSRYIFKNSKFIKNATTNEFGETLNKYNFSIDGQLTDISQNQNIECYNCEFINTLSSADSHNIKIFSGHYHANSSLTLIDCKFYNADPTKNSIYLTNTLNVNSGIENGLLKYYLDGNKSNVAVDVQGGGLTKIVNNLTSLGILTSSTYKIY